MATTRLARPRRIGDGKVAFKRHHHHRREVLNRLARANVFLRADAMEYLANAQEAWFPQDHAADAEPIESLIEKLDATVFGLIEALDSGSAELPRLIDEA